MLARANRHNYSVEFASSPRVTTVLRRNDYLLYSYPFLLYMKLCTRLKSLWKQACPGLILETGQRIFAGYSYSRPREILPQPWTQLSSQVPSPVCVRLYNYRAWGDRKNIFPVKYSLFKLRLQHFWLLFNYFQW